MTETTTEVTVSHLRIIFPQVPKNVRNPVAPLFQEWADIAEPYERAPESLRAAWLYLGHHPAFWTLQKGPGTCYVASGAGWYQSLELGVDEDGFVWLEVQPAYWPDDPTEDEYQDAAPDDAPHRFEVLEETYEQAVIAAAKEVHDRCGNDREFLKLPLLADKWY